MKALYKNLKAILLMASSALLLTAPSCSESQEETPTPPTVKIDLTISEVSTTADAVDATVTPSDNQATYYAGIHTAAEVVEDEAAALIQQLISSGDFASKLLKGTQKVSATGLEAETNYYVVAFGYDVASGAFTSDVVFKKATTLKAAGYAETLTLTLQEEETTWRDAVVLVEPSSKEVEYIRDVCTKEMFEQQFGSDPQAVVEYQISIFKSDAVMYGDEEDEWPEAMQWYQYNGDKMFYMSEIRNLRWGEEYVFYCFGMNDAGEQTTEVYTLPFSTLAPTPSSNELSITIHETTTSRVDFTVNTTNDDPYYITIQSADYLERFGEGKEESYEDLIFDLTFEQTDDQLLGNVFRGTQRLTNENLTRVISINGFKEYRIVVWGFQNGPTTEVVLSETFKPGTTHQPTPTPEPEPEVIPFSIWFEDITATSAYVTVTPQDASVKWYWGGCDKAKFDARYADDLQKIIDKHINDWEFFADLYGDPTWQDSMLYDLKSGTHSGKATDIIGEESLNGGTEYVIWAFGMNTDGTPSTEVVYKTFTTL